jgi:hypothetical protein
MLAAAATAALLLAGCGRAGTPGSAPTATATATATAAATASQGNTLRLKVDGIDWIAERDIFCAVHPPGYDRAIVVAGARGAKDASEQSFNLNLYGVDTPGARHLESANAGASAIQLANLDATRYLNGGVLGFDVRVELLQMGKNPGVVEARFEGTLDSSSGARLRITDGYVLCHE